MAQQGVKFVRVRGRIVPIKQKGYESGYKKIAAIGAATGLARGASSVSQLGVSVLAARGNTAGALRAAKSAKVFGRIGIGIGLAGTAYSGYKAYQKRKSGGSVLGTAGTFIAHNIVGNLGAAAGSAAVGAGLGIAAAAKMLKKGKAVNAARKLLKR